MEDLENLEPLLPKVKNIAPTTIGLDIFPFIPGDAKNNKIWDEMFKEIVDNVKKEFKEKGIPMPHLVLRTDKISINEILDHEREEKEINKKDIYDGENPSQ